MKMQSLQPRLKNLRHLIAMVEAERAHHQRMVNVFDEFREEILSELQFMESASPSVDESSIQPTIDGEPNMKIAGESTDTSVENTNYFLAEVIHAFEAGSNQELNLAVGDYLVVRRVSSTGWSEGECKGKAGWFPSACVERRECAPANKFYRHMSIFWTTY